MTDNSTSRDTPTKDRPAPAPTGVEAFPNIQNGRYTFIKIIGSGGAGTVYKAHDNRLDKTVAIKKLHNTNNQSQAIRFQREAKLIGALNHENVLTALDFGITEKNEPYLVLDFVDKSESLAALLKRNGPLKGTDALEILIDIARGLAHAHQHKILHRDIKPNNVILVNGTSTSGEFRRIARIVDFGLGKYVDDDQLLTKSGVGFGTPLYMSPEQSRGRDVDHRSDIYSFGCLMFEVLAGKPPFYSDNPILIANMHESEPVPDLSDIDIPCSKPTEVIMRKCLQKDPDHRYQSFDAILSDLRLAWSTAVQEEHELDAKLKLENATINTEETLRTSDKSLTTFTTKHYIWCAVALIAVSLTLLALVADQASHEKVAVAPSEGKKFQREISVNVNIGKFTPSGAVDSMHQDVHRSNVFDAVDPSDRDLEQWLKTEPKIDQVSISGSTLSPHKYKLLKDRGLIALGLHEMPITDELLEAISTIKSLKVLTITEPSSFDSKAIKVLKRLPALERISLMHTKPDAEFYKEFLPLTQVSELELRGCTGITRDDMSVIAKRELNALNLDKTEVDDNIIEPIMSSPIKDIFLDSTKITDKTIERTIRWKGNHLLKVTKTNTTEKCRKLVTSKRANQIQFLSSPRRTESFIDAKDLEGSREYNDLGKQQ